MAQRRAPGSPSSRDVPEIEFRAPLRARRALAAFVLGAALSTAGIGALIASGAAAHGPFTAANPTTFSAPAPARAVPNQPTYSIVHVEPHAPAGNPARAQARPHARDDDDEDEARKKHRGRITIVHGRSSLAKVARFSTPAPVCVRLCDGFFFPLTAAAADSVSQVAACNSLCPDAPTEVYYRNGSDRIEDAISSKGQPYTALPVSLRYRNSSDNACTCHRDVVAYAPLRDASLRRGDAVMTPAGFLVFRGVEGGAHTPRDFLALNQARLPSSQRGALQAMERVSLATDHPSLEKWMISQSAPAQIAQDKAKPPALAGAAISEDKIRVLVWRGAKD